MGGPFNNSVPAYNFTHTFFSLKSRQLLPTEIPASLPD
ncbi:hypothetical protein DCCM_2591 [Desulfocucumis palustris]|uniref:Uncharacterized protein n=1 Tax=Desulfocucumis palustris TaxID=1898651 RepID=A0A2L2XB25_9FIRM|nr:hypothetical protein DCCM_2591 [Desulfocucumis palustris]